jgi:DNA-binding transcriptional ArsR family regulator
MYLVLEDPDRRIRDRLLDTDHEFRTAVARDSCIFHIAPGFTLTDDNMWRWLEATIIAGRRSVVFLDTYQKATPGLSSFDDIQQGPVLHKLVDLTRRLSVTLLVLDHVRKQPNGPTRRGDLAIDDLKGTGGKAQNADCVILLERTVDKKQLKLQAFSKDFDQPIRILLNVAPRGSQDAKFTYAGDLEQFGASATNRGIESQRRILEAMAADTWLSVTEIADVVDLNKSTVSRHLKTLAVAGQVNHNDCTGRRLRYRRPLQTDVAAGTPFCNVSGTPDGSKTSTLQ